MGKKGNPARGKKFKRIKRKEKTFDEMASLLKQKINISDEEIRVQYQDFQNCYPEGTISEEQFMEIFANNTVFSPMSLFRVFDEDGSGSLDFLEFTLALNCTSLNNPEDKLSWIFNVFDEDGGGTIDIDEVKKLVVSLLKLTSTPVVSDNIEACVKAIIDTMDEDGNGQISKDEFVNNALKIEFINNILNAEEDEA